MQDQNHLCWLDMEMTGLNPDTDKIIEVAMIITDKDLNVLAESEVYAVHQSDEVLDAMDEWNQNTHGRTGLIGRVRASSYSEAEVEQRLLDFMAQWIPAKTTPMCGNTIHQDRRFMVRHMPRLEAYFHYRNLDVYDAFCRQLPQAENAFEPIDAANGKYLADIYQLARQVLKHCGVAQISGGNHCTVLERERFFSYRRDGQTGRMVSAIWLQG